MRLLLSLLLLASLLVGCTRVEGGITEADDPNIAPGEEAPIATSPIPEEHPSRDEMPMPRWEGTYRVFFQPGSICTTGCITSSTAVERPIFTMEFNQSDPRVMNATHFRLTATWTAKTPLATVANFSFQSDDETVTAYFGQGTSPFVSEVPKDDFLLGRDYHLRVHVAPPGALIDQEVLVVLELIASTGA